ncbi:unnamed protein product [Schistocephalus solidus]|uniref:Secreted protein n=1 Tax=Schistocephalus solidus TaxID=70667 RepID=A0A183TSS2_SCHSO|nr:unnamed protein product [Schistocephalus solidus]
MQVNIDFCIVIWRVGAVLEIVPTPCSAHPLFVEPKKDRLDAGQLSKPPSLPEQPTLTMLVIPFLQLREGTKSPPEHPVRGVHPLSPS